MSAPPTPEPPERWLETVLLGAAEQAELGVAVMLVEGAQIHPVFVNQSGAALVGRSRESFLAAAPFDHFVDTWRPRLQAMVQRLDAGEALEPFEAIAQRADGSTVPVEVSVANVVSGSRRYAVTFFRDVSGRHAADAALLSSEARFRALVEGAPDGVVISRNGRILYLNPAAVRLLGYDTAEELVGQSMAVFLDAPEIGRMVSRIAALSDGVLPSATEYAATRRDGARIVAEITSLPIGFEGGPAVVAFARDVTERSRMQQQLARADRLASLGTLAAGVAHEVNNPLTFMTLGLELCARRIQGSTLAPTEKEQLLATLADVRGGADRVALVVRDLKTFSRVAEDEPQEVDVHEVIHAAVRIVAHRSRHFAEVVVELASPLARVAANAARLEQVFVNLLLNAVQAFDEARPENRIVVRGSDSGDGHVFVDVIDNGPGVPAEVLGRIFDPFFTTKPVGEGTGLGLAIVHGLLAQVGGGVSVQDPSGPGAHFRVTLPVATGLRVSERLAPPPRASTERRARILVIDDEREVATVIQRSLEPKHDVVAVTTAAEALDRLLSQQEFDVVLCDLAMPGMSGTDLYRAVTRDRPELARRFVIITGGAVSGRMQGFLDAWSGPRLEKPFTRSELEGAVSATLGAASRATSGP